jgi:hypothetical protein
MPCCKKHHDHFHALLRMAGVSLEYTSDPRERLLRALKAVQVFEWMLLEALNETLNEKAEVKGDARTPGNLCPRSHRCRGEKTTAAPSANEMAG